MYKTIDKTEVNNITEHLLYVKHCPESIIIIIILIITILAEFHCNYQFSMRKLKFKVVKKLIQNINSDAIQLFMSLKHYKMHYYFILCNKSLCGCDTLTP